MQCRTPVNFGWPILDSGLGMVDFGLVPGEHVTEAER
jgi:hypothetical protein